MATEDQTNVTDYLLGLDDLQRPRVVDMSIIKPNEWNSAILMIARMILFVPGTYEDQPELGIDIRGRYRFAFEEELHQLSQDIEAQITRFLPEFQLVSVSVYTKTKEIKVYIVIDIQLDQVTYRLIYDAAENVLLGLEDL